MYQTIAWVVGASLSGAGIIATVDACWDMTTRVKEAVIKAAEKDAPEPRDVLKRSYVKRPLTSYKASCQTRI